MLSLFLFFWFVGFLFTLGFGIDELGTPNKLESALALILWPMALGRMISEKLGK